MKSNIFTGIRRQYHKYKYKTNFLTKRHQKLKLFAPAREANASLPHLPVPDLHDTLNKYIRSIEPLVSKVSGERLKTTKKLVREFGKPGGEGEILQKELVLRAEQKENWLADWWEQVAYLSDPTPNALFVNMVTGFGSFQDFDRPVSQARRASETVRYTCEYIERLKREQVPPETMGGRVLCMEMFRRLFSACRIPDRPTDRFTRVDPATVRHITVALAVPELRSSGK
ncbi:hypothetical protein DVH05_009701 [Phytophthora capsici]|nr:hypothetical protein DVH05_009701 [Phytophthora capsici]